MAEKIISIITPTYNRKDELASLITSVQNQSLSHDLFEMIISDDGSSDGTTDMVRLLQPKVNFSLRFIEQKNQGPGVARNHGMETARGELFLFIDSDCEADPRWAETIYHVYKKEGFDACGGPDGAKEDFSALQKAIDFSMTSFLTTGGMRGHSEKMLAKFYPRSHNMGMTKKMYQKVGGFGSLRHGQDIELSHRLISNGAQIKFIPDAIVYHRRRTSLKQFFRQVFNWGVARVNLGKIDSEMLEMIHFLPSVATLIIVTVTIGSIVLPVIFFPWFLLGIGWILILSVWAGIKKHNTKVGLYSLLVIPIQIIGYGLGFLFSFVRRFLFGKGEWTGFTRRYYQ